MPVAVASTPGDDAGPPEAGLAARVAAGPGLWEDEDWLADLRRESLAESLLADGTIAAAAAAGHAHKQERALNAEVTALCLVTGALFPVLGYDPVLALVFGLPGLPARPGTPVPTGPAYSKARARSGETPARAMFGHDAARDDIPAGPDGTAFGLEITQIDGTTLELFKDPLLAEEFGVPSPGAKPLLRLVGLLQERREVRPLQDPQSAERRIRAGPAPREQRHARPPPQGRRKAAAGPALPSLPDTTARLICFTVLTRTRSGRVKTTQIRLLTTLLDPDACPAGELAVLYQKRWLIEIAFLHLKRTVRGSGRVLRGRSAVLVRQEAWALLLAHNMIAGLAARAAATAGLTPGEITFTAVLSLARAAITVDTCCPHCHKRPASPNAPLASLGAAITALPPGRAGRQRTSGRTPAERRKWTSEPAEYTLTIAPSNLPKTDISLGS